MALSVPPVLALALTGCSAPADTNGPETSGTTATQTQGPPSEHVHGVATNPGDNKVYLATHTACSATTTPARSDSVRRST